MPVTDPSMPALLQKGADQQPDAVAFAYIDHGQDQTGFAESLLAPQGLEYVVAFLDALQPGFIAVPLSVPQFGIHDDRVSSALRDANPVAIPTSAVVGDVNKYATGHDGYPAPSIIEIDLLDLDSPREPPRTHQFSSGAAYLQYTSRSTCAPAGICAPTVAGRMLKLRSVKGEVTSAISKSHSLRVADLVPVSPGSIPITTSGKIRRSACVESYRSDGFKRLDVAV